MHTVGTAAVAANSSEGCPKASRGGASNSHRQTTDVTMGAEEGQKAAGTGNAG